jgi:hypothetical protein
MEDDPSPLPSSVVAAVVSNFTDLNDDCLQTVELRLPLAGAASFRALCKHTAGLVSPVRDELEWARRAAKSGFDTPAAVRLAELKGMLRAAAHFGTAPLTMDTMEVAARLLTGEPLAGFEQMQPDISAAGGEYLLAERILSDRRWSWLPRSRLTSAGARTLANVFDPMRPPDSCTDQLAVAVSCCCDARSLSKICDLGGVYFEYVLNLLLDHPVPVPERHAALLLGGLQLAEQDNLELMAESLLEQGTVGQLVTWVFKEGTADAALGLLIPLVVYESSVWHMAVEAEPALPARVCALTHHGAACASAFHLLRVLCREQLIELDAPNEDQLPADVRAVPDALAFSADGVTGAASCDEADSGSRGPPELSGGERLAWICLVFLNILQKANPSLVQDAKVLRAVSASLSAHTSPHVTGLAYEFVNQALEASPEMEGDEDVQEPLSGLLRDANRHSPMRSKAARLMVNILKLTDQGQHCLRCIRGESGSSDAGALGTS